MTTKGSSRALTTVSIAEKPLALSLWLADILRGRIVRGEIAPGSRLIEADIAAEYDISRSPVREALRMLERDALVEVVSRKGAVVIPLDVRSVEDLYAARIAVEGMAARMTAERMTDTALAELRAAFARMAEAAEHDDLEAYLRVADAFYRIEWGIAGNPWLTQMVKVLGYQNQRLRRRMNAIPGQSQRIVAAYRGVMCAYAARDGEQAERLMRAILAESCTILVEDLRRNPPSPLDGR